jgi:AraC-like DNA-binding protein
MFASSYDLQRHDENGCPMKMDTDDDEMSNISDNDEGFVSLVNEVWEENQSQFNKKFAQLVEKNSELSKKEAREEVTEMMLPKDRALLLKKYKRIFLISAKLNESKLHRDIEKAVSTLMEETDMDLDRTISRVLNRYRHEFDRLLEADESHFKENSDEEHDMED